MLSDEDKKRLRADALTALSLHAVKCDDNPKWKLKSGRPSHIYIDMRELFGKPACMPLIELMADELRSEFIQTIGGMEAGAIAPAAMLTTNGFNSFYVRKAVKGHGTKKRVEGYVGASRIGILEDVTTTGDSALEALNVFEAETPRYICAVNTFVDRSFGEAKKAVRARGKAFTALFTLDDLTFIPPDILAKERALFEAWKAEQPAA